MLSFLQRLIDPLSALLLFAWVVTLFSYLMSGYGAAWGQPEGGRRYGSIIAFVLFVIVLVVCFIAWAVRVFG